jgi:N-acetylglucosamine kinase-like BadF-type ATPase
MSLFLAIDAGGTKTECLLADDERVLARAATGTVKLMRVAEEEASERLRAMLGEVAAAAGVSLGEVTRTCFGLAGLSSAAVREWAQRTVRGTVAGELVLCGDEEIALDAAFRGGAGILVVAGTGSNAIGRAADGRVVGAGGWGPVLGDEGSGYWIGLEATRAALRAHDLLAPTRGGAGGSDELREGDCLLREIQRHWGLGSLAELVALANQRGDGARAAPDFAELAPLVARCAEQGDAVAAEVLGRAGGELAELVGLVCGKMGAGGVDGDEVGVAFTGSVLAQIAPVRAAMVARLVVLAPNARVQEGAVDPLEGALWRARRG